MASEDKTNGDEVVSETGRAEIHINRIREHLDKANDELSRLEYYIKYVTRPERYETLSKRNYKALELLRAGDVLNAEVVLDGCGDDLLEEKSV